MIYPTLNELMKRTDSRYTLVVQVAKRARKLVAGANPLIEIDSDKEVTIDTNKDNRD